MKGTLTTTANNAQQYDVSQIIPFNSTINAVWALEVRPGSSAAGTPGDCIDLLYTPNTASATVAQTLVSTGVMFNFASSTVSSAGYGQIALTSTATATAGGYNTGNIIVNSTQFNPPVLLRGGILTCSVKTVATTPGADLVIVVDLNRQRQGGGTDPVQFGTYNADSDIF